MGQPEREYCMGIIEARGLARTFRSRKRSVEAVRGVDLTVEDGEIDADHAHYALFLPDAQDDPVLAAPGASEAFQLIMQGLGDSPGILAERPVDELENRPGGVERDSPGRPCPACHANKLNENSEKLLYQLNE
jgi:hypothetical protein